MSVVTEKNPQNPNMRMIRHSMCVHITEISLHSFIFSKHFLLVKVVVHSVPFPETLDLSGNTSWIGLDALSHMATINHRQYYYLYLFKFFLGRGRKVEKSRQKQREHKLGLG